MKNLQYCMKLYVRTKKILAAKYMVKHIKLNLKLMNFKKKYIKKNKKNTAFDKNKLKNFVLFLCQPFRY